MNGGMQHRMEQLQKKDLKIKQEAIDRAREILRGERQLGANEIMTLCLELEAKDLFSYATELLLIKMRLDETLKKSTSPEDHQTLAKYIYKDHSLPSSTKFDRAITELEVHCNLLTTDNCETLGMAGSIYKNRWLHDHQYMNLELSRAYYKRGLTSWEGYNAKTNTSLYCNDDGYAAINFAYINELMAINRLEETGRKLNDFAPIDSLLEESKQTRLYVLDALRACEIHEQSLPSFWKLVTIAEAFFGLCDYANATKFIQYSILRKKHDLAERREQGTLAWQLRAFHRQLSSIAYLHHFLTTWTASSNHSSAIINAISTAVDNRLMNECLSLLADPANEKEKMNAPIHERQQGKVGLSLSGGGFRAAMYHIGVLAALAEQDILKDVEVISCVSGGSIIGTFYYLKLKLCLESQPDGTINYIEIIREIEKEFVAGVQTNLRMQVFSSFAANLKMITSDNYSRTHRLGELYERHLFKKISGSDAAIRMEDLIIKPFQDPDFSLATDNWKRRNKIPQLILNATTVNTGHNWQFTASWMGEPPGNILQHIDMKPRLRRMYYRDAPGDYKNFRLGHAVAASSCVPFLFEPMPMPNLYQHEDSTPLYVQLIDGGLHDNQGIAALIEQECKTFIISDASGQMSLQSNNTTSELSVFYRADTILQERLREIQFQDINERHSSAQINTLTSVHLKSELHQKPISWIHCQDTARKLLEVNDNYDQLTGYGILRESQKLLSEIRTDLDSFNDVESYSLMYSGYAQTTLKLRANNQFRFTRTKDWKFLAIRPFLSDKEKSEQILKILKTSSKIPTKILHVSNTVKAFTALLLISALILFTMYGIKHRSDIIISLGISDLLFTGAVIVVGFIADFLARLINYRSYIRKKIILVAICTISFVATNFYLLILNPVYNRAGKIPGKK